MSKNLKYKKNIVFNYDSNEYFLFQIINFGKKKEDEFKFIYGNPSGGTGVIYMDEGLTLDDDSVITPYGELTYHKDGSILNKFPNYPIKSRVHINPDGSGKRRTPISEIKDWESLFIYEIFDYKINKLKSEISIEKKVTIDEYFVMNRGLPFKVLVCLVRDSYKPFGSDINNSLIKNIFINGVGENLSLWLMFSYSKKKGFWIEMEGGGKKVFSKNNRMKTYERK